MANIEKQISPLIENLFPDFYKTDGDNFIAFVKAYYEWLEENHQLIELENPTNFNIGDTIQQAETTGVIVAKIANGDIIVRINGFDTFKCYNVCSELIIVTSSSGGSSYIKRGGTSRRLGPLFMSRNLLELRDIDSTMELFIVKFKEKYLKNIEFDVQTNKQLLIKNSLDLYRSKGTERSVDLFFRLVYGVSAQVQNPGEQVFKLSDGTWYNPVYLEVTPSDRSISLVGRQITGVTSGATAFVEKYIKRKIKDGFVYILYLSNVRGSFINTEILKYDVIYPDSPKVVGSLKRVDIVSGSSGFSVGDVVSFNSTVGDYGLARVESVSDISGIVDFIFIDGGYGYTVSANSLLSNTELAERSQSIVSEKVLTLSNVSISNVCSAFIVANSGSGYTNTDICIVRSNIGDATGVIRTNGSGGIVSVTVSNTGAGFTTSSPTVLISNSTGGTTTGTGANVVASTTASKKYFNYFESVKERKADVTYDTATNNQLLIPGSQVRFGNSSVNTAFGIILSNANNTLANANGILSIATFNNAPVGTGNTIYLISNSAVTANIASVTDTTAIGTVMGVPNTAILTLNNIVNGPFVRGDEVYQLNNQSEEVGNGIISTTSTGTVSGTLYVDELKGVLYSNNALRVRNKTTTANVVNVSLTVGLWDINETFSNTFAPQVFSTQTGTFANLVNVSTGSGASFKVSTISDTETIYLNTDPLYGNNYPLAGANQAYMSLPLNSLAYGFPKNPAGNSESIIFSCLNFDNFTIGTIGSLAAINPGTDYNVDPYVLVQQPYISGFDFHDYVINIGSATGEFSAGERILQTNTTINYYDLIVSDETGYTVGEKVYQGTAGSETATGIVFSITPSANTITVNQVTGTFATATALKSYITPALSATVDTINTQSIITTAKGIVKSANSSTLFVKRIQFNNDFTVGQTIRGSQSGTTATILGVVEDANTLPIGLNAQITGSVITATGTVTGLEVIDSGVGYANGTVAAFTSEDGERSGEVKVILDGAGVGRGYYKTSKGFLSSTSYLHDGDYYQEYSYEVLTRVPFDKYKDMFKKVMHTSGTRLFGGVLIEELANVELSYADSEVTKSTTTTIQFNSNTNVVSNAIVLDNTDANNALIFPNQTKVVYYTHSGNTVITPLANNTSYYVANANTTAIKLTTNPRLVSSNFNANVDISSSFISIPRHSFQNNDVVRYTTYPGNTAVTGLSNNTVYHIVSANNSGVKLSTSRGGAPVSITASSISENGHILQIATINIVANTTASGAATNGHFIVHANEI